LLLPFVASARRAVAARAGSSPLTAAAAHALERHLLQRLTSLCAPALLAEFEARRPAGRMHLTLFLNDRTRAGPRPRERYAAFIAELHSAELRPFFERYPPLARLIDQTVRAWCDETAELIDRIGADLPSFAACFGRPAAARVVAIEPGLSDPHHGGRSVMVLTFDSGAKLVYKPRPLEADAAFGGFLTWCDAGFRSPRTLLRGAYGWAEFIAVEPCAAEAQIRAFYARAGMLLCVLYLLGTTDCHAENLIATGDQLVVVDAETALQPQLRAGAARRDAAWNSVLRAGLLPHWDLDDGERAFDMTALGAFDELQGPVRVPQWRHVNTDDMALGDAMRPPIAPRSLPWLRGAPVSPVPYRGALLEGFERMYRTLAERRDELTAAARAHDGPLRTLAAPRVRFVARPTRDYAAMLWTSVQPEHLRSEHDRSALLDSIARRGAHAAFAPLLDAERRALERLDVPHFVVAATGTLVESGDGPPADIPQLFAAFGAVEERLRAWGERDLREQRTVANGALEARMTRTAADAGADARSAARPGVADAGRAHIAERAIDAARRIADALTATSAIAPDGSARWFGLRHLTAADRYALEPAGVALYEGAAGIAVFLATLDAVTAQRTFAPLALAAIAPLRHGAPGATAATIGIGGGGGLGSCAYALARLARLLDEPALLDDARALALRIDDAAIAADRELDVIGGAAGAILGLLAVHRAAPDERILARAIVAGNHLLRTRTGEPGMRAWRVRTERSLTGFAHGAAGIALALLRLFAATGDVSFRAAAREAIAYERSVFVAAARNWPDLRAGSETQGEPVCSTMWCHGAPGIGLARLAGADIDRDEHTAREIDDAIATTLASALRERDHLCCGNAGRADILLEAGLRLNRAPLRERAEEMVAVMIARAGSSGEYRLGFDTASCAMKPSLFRGAAGVGYQFLRIARPAGVPSVLLWN
jgi:class II lanthipeptide synthase